MKNIQRPEGRVCCVMLAQPRGGRKELMLGNAALIQDAFQPRSAYTLQRQPTFHGADFTGYNESSNGVLRLENAKPRHREYRPLFRTPPLPRSLPVLILSHKQRHDEAGVRVDHASPRRS